MTVHVFGGISLPSCSNCALKKTVADNVKKYGEEVSFILRHNLYVDDMLKDFPSLHKVNSLCKKGGLNLIHEFWILTEDKELGVKWNIEEDTLGFTKKMDDKPTTQCGFLAVLSSVCNQLGLGAPFLLSGRLIIQRLCKNYLTEISQ